MRITMGRRRSNKKRHPSGKVIQPTVKEIKRIVLAQRKKFLSATLAENELSSYPLGLMSLRGEGHAMGINQRQFDAGVRWARAVFRYRSVMGLPLDRAVAFDFNAVPGTSLSGDMDETTVQNVLRRYDDATGALRDAGWEALAAVNDICIRDEMPEPYGPCQHAKFRSGLDALAQHFKIR